MLSVVVPVYNEIDNVVPLVERVRATLDPMGCRGSWWRSTTARPTARANGWTSWPRAKIGCVCCTSRRTAASPRVSTPVSSTPAGDLVALLDADLQTFPEDLPRLLEVLESEGLDAVVGIRAERRDTGWKRFSSRFANGVRNRLTREDIEDTGCPIKVFRAEAIRSVKIFTGMHRFLPTLLRMEGYTVKQVPVRHAERTAGTSKYGTWDRAFSGLRDALAVRWMQDRRMRWRLRN